MHLGAILFQNRSVTLEGSLERQVEMLLGHYERVFIDQNRFCDHTENLQFVSTSTSNVVQNLCLAYVISFYIHF